MTWPLYQAHHTCGSEPLGTLWWLPDPLRGWPCGLAPSNLIFCHSKPQRVPPTHHDLPHPGSLALSPTGTNTCSFPLRSTPDWKVLGFEDTAYSPPSLNCGEDGAEGFERRRLWLLEQSHQEQAAVGLATVLSHQQGTVCPGPWSPYEQSPSV